jgi:hypothetical protein
MQGPAVFNTGGMRGLGASQVCRSLTQSGYKTDRDVIDATLMGKIIRFNTQFTPTHSKKMTLTKSLFLTLMSAAALSRAAKVHYDLDLTWQRGSPNGHEREMIFVNDRFPGPPLIMDEGDEVTVSLILRSPSIHTKKNR